MLSVFCMRQAASGRKLCGVIKTFLLSSLISIRSLLIFYLVKRYYLLRLFRISYLEFNNVWVYPAELDC